MDRRRWTSTACARASPRGSIAHLACCRSCPIRAAPAGTSAGSSISSSRSKTTSCVTSSTRRPTGSGCWTIVAELMSGRLDRSRPLWAYHLVELERGRHALVGLIHHCMADGMTAMRLASKVLWDEQAGLRLAAKTGSSTGTAHAEDPGHQQRVSMRRCVTRELMPKAHDTPLDRHPTNERTVAVALASLDRAEAGRQTSRRNRQRCRALCRRRRPALVAGVPRRPARGSHGQGAGQPARSRRGLGRARQPRLVHGDRRRHRRARSAAAARDDRRSDARPQDAARRSDARSRVHRLRHISGRASNAISQMVGQPARVHDQRLERARPARADHRCSTAR